MRNIHQENVKVMNIQAVLTCLFGVLAMAVTLIMAPTADAAAEEKVQITVEANRIQMTPNITRTPIRSARIRSTELRELIKSLGATHIERVYEAAVEGVEPEAVADTYVLIFPSGTGATAKIGDFSALEVVQNAQLA